MSSIAFTSHRTVATALPIGMMIGLFVLSSVPGTINPEDPAAYQIFLWVPPDIQNLLHVPVYGLLAALCYRAARTWRYRRGLSAGLAFAVTAAYGWFDEWHQMHVPGRYGSFTDFSLDVLGAAVALAFLLLRRPHP